MKQLCKQMQLRLFWKRAHEIAYSSQNQKHIIYKQSQYSEETRIFPFLYFSLLTYDIVNCHCEYG